jgi:hypothetical protein
MTQRVFDPPPRRRMTTYQDAFTMDSEWTRAFFALSGDQNHALHGDEGNIVQGVAIITKIGTVLSARFPGYVVTSIGALEFKAPVIIGNTLVMETTAATELRNLEELDVTLLLNEYPILRTKVTMVSASLFDRMRKRG